MNDLSNSIQDGPRERAWATGINSLTDTELIAALLGTGSPTTPVGAVAHELLADVGSIQTLSHLGPAEIARTPGVGPAKAVRIAAAMELGRRARQLPPNPSFAHAHDAAAWLTPRLGHLDHEELWVLALDRRHRLRGVRRVAQGGVHGCGASPRDMLRGALLDGAATMLIAHNHPSGNPTPSEEDLRTTLEERDAGRLVGLPLLDHLVVTETGRYVSMLARGIL